MSPLFYFKHITHYFRVCNFGVMPKKIIKFNISNNFDFLLLALVCSVKDYRLCFELNTQLKINLKRQADIELILDKQKNKSFFSNYYCLQDEEQYHVISNKGSNGSFIPEKKTIDYFLLIKNLSAKKNIDHLISNLKKIEIISGVYEMDPNELKSGENFLIVE